MDYSRDNQNWDSLSYVEKNHQLYLKQKALLDQFLEKVQSLRHSMIRVSMI